MTDRLESTAAQLILKHAVAPYSVLMDGNYTKPKTWGVYEIDPQPNNGSTRRFRLGNHPVRQRELEKEVGAATLVALFTSRGLAEELERLLNDRI